MQKQEEQQNIKKRNQNQNSMKISTESNDGLLFLPDQVNQKPTSSSKMIERESFYAREWLGLDKNGQKAHNKLVAVLGAPNNSSSYNRGRGSENRDKRQ